jgi:hypothetical protein
MPDLSGLWRALQNIGVAGITILALWLVTRGELVTRRSHEEIVRALGETNAALQKEIDRLHAMLSALGRGSVGDDD